MGELLHHSSPAGDELSAAIAGAQAGQAEAFDVLIDAFSKRLFGYFYRLTASRPEAEDLLQELFVRLVHAIRSYEHEGRFDAFLFRIATNLYRDRLRVQRRSGRPASLDELEAGERPAWPATAAAPQAHLERREQARLLDAAVQALPEHEREVVVLRHFSDMSFKDIAELLQAPLGTVLARAHRGLQRIRRALEGHQP